jgi:hypothetical protein
MWLGGKKHSNRRNYNISNTDKPFDLLGSVGASTMVLHFNFFSERAFASCQDVLFPCGLSSSACLMFV